MEKSRLILVFLLALLLINSGKVPGASVSRVTYVFDDQPIPLAVRVGFDQLNREGISATSVDVDSGGTLYELAIPAARQAGLPAIVVEAGDQVAKVITNIPTTPQAVVKAVR